MSNPKQAYCEFTSAKAMQDSKAMAIFSLIKSLPSIIADLSENLAGYRQSLKMK